MGGREAEGRLRWVEGYYPALVRVEIRCLGGKGRINIDRAFGLRLRGDDGLRKRKVGWGLEEIRDLRREFWAAGPGNGEATGGSALGTRRAGEGGFGLK